MKGNEMFILKLTNNIAYQSLLVKEKIYFLYTLFREYETIRDDPATKAPYMLILEVFF